MIKDYMISIKLVQVNVLHDDCISTLSNNIDPRLEKMLLDKCTEKAEYFNDLEDAISLHFSYLVDDLKVTYKDSHLVIKLTTSDDSTALFAQLINTCSRLGDQLSQCYFTSGESNYHFIQMTNNVDIKIS